MTTTVRAAECPSCQSTFPVEPERVPEGGVHARCSSCWRVFFVPPAVSLPVFGQDVEGLSSSASEDLVEGVPPDDDRVELREDGPDGAFSSSEEEPSPDHDDGTGLAAEPPAPYGGASDFGPALETPEPGVADPEGPVQGSGPAVSHPGPDTGPEAQEPPPADPVPDMPPEPAQSPAPPDRGGPTESESTRARAVFGRRDPHERAQRLARVLVSDMIVYHSDRHQRALQQGTLQEEFDEEIRKSWEQYVEQVGEEMANQHDYFREALNELLARGEEVF